MTELQFPHEITGWLTPAEGAQLFQLARNNLVLELGSYCGLSTLCLAQSAHRMHAVDWHQGDEHTGPAATLTRFVENVYGRGFACKVVLHLGRFEEVLPALQAAHFDLIFLDGQHDPYSVTRDTRLALRCLQPGGTMAWHDYGHGAHPGVQHLVDELAERLQTPLSAPVDTLAFLRIDDPCLALALLPAIA